MNKKVTTDADRFAAWLKGDSVASASRETSKTRKEVKHGLLIEQYDGNPSCTDGKRRGFNGIKPRTSAPEITGPCVVTTAEGHRYTIKRTSNRSSTPTVRTSKGNYAATYENLLNLVGATGDND